MTSAIERGVGVKNWSKLLTDSTKKTDMGEGGVKNPEKMLTSFMDGPLQLITPLANRYKFKIGS